MAGVLTSCASGDDVASTTPAPTPANPTTYRYGDSPEQFATLALPSTPGPHPVVVLIHGGFWRAAYGLDLMEPLAAVGHSAGGHLALWAAGRGSLDPGAPGADPVVDFLGVRDHRG
jgi:acetyl esterase/lipase